jgi:glucosamine--fructose-6-phosphate aminotransferase (isomerizing)
VSVASTKAFLSQLTALALFTIFLGRQRGMTAAQGKEIAHALKELPEKLQAILDTKEEIEKLAKKYTHSRDFHIDRKYDYPIATKEPSSSKKFHIFTPKAAGQADEARTIAMIDENFPTMALAPKDSMYEKMTSNIHKSAQRSCHRRRHGGDTRCKLGTTSSMCHKRLRC